MIVRAEIPADHERVREVQEAAFGAPGEALLVDLLREQAEPQLSLVAEREGRVVGHVFFSPVALEGEDAPSAAGLAPVGVDPAHQGAGIGSALIRAGLEACPALGWRAVFLVGAPAYYQRFGFVLAAPRGFSYGDPVFDAAFQLIELEPGVLDGGGGRVRYHEAFSASGTG